MAEPMTTRVEVWPLGADATGIWLLSGDDAWRPALPVMADSEPHAEIELELARHDALDDAVLLHSPSWRTDGAAVVLTYVVVVECGAVVRDRWPGARPVGVRLAQLVGHPSAHSPVEPPAPRYVDVLFHALRHLRFLLDTDAANAAALDKWWRRHLATLRPSLSGMYGQTRVPPSKHPELS